MAGLRGVSQKQPNKMDDAEIDEAVYLRYALGLSWEDVAEKMGRTRRTLYNQRQTERWRDSAKRLYDGMREEGLPEAWGCLSRATRKDDVAAAREILDRLLGKVTQPVTSDNRHTFDFDKLDPETRRATARGLREAANGKASASDVPGCPTDEA